MKPITINVQITRNPKQYEAVRLGMEATLDNGEKAENAIKEATAQLNAIYEEMYGNGQKAPQTPQKAPAKEPEKKEPETPQHGPEKKDPKQEEKKPETLQREPLKFGDPRLQQIVVRIEKAAGDHERINKVLENVYKYFAPDAEAEKVISLAVKLNN